MSLETIYFIGQAIAVHALIVSLFFAGVQNRQNTEQSRAAAVDAAHCSFLDCYYNQSPDTAANFVKANRALQVSPRKTDFCFSQMACPCP